MKKLLVILVIAALLVVSANVAFAAGRPLTQGETIFVELVPDVIGDRATANAVFDQSPRQYETDVVADTWIVMTDAGRTCLADVAADTQAAWKKYPGAKKVDCMNDIVSVLADGKPVGPNMATVSAKTIKEFKALTTLDRAYVLSAYCALTVLVQNYKPAK
ncbi:MAG: hypothetical protein WCP79_13775 [Bacillota bacterium]